MQMAKCQINSDSDLNKDHIIFVLIVKSNKQNKNNPGSVQSLNSLQAAHLSLWRQ